MDPAGRKNGRPVSPPVLAFGPPPERPLAREATVAVIASKPFARVVETVRPDAAAQRAQALGALLGRHGLSEQALAETDARIPHHLSLELLEWSAWIVGSEAIALRAVQGWQMGDHGIGDYLNATCETAGDFLRTIVNHVGLLNDGIRFSVDSDGETVRLYYDLYPGVVRSHWFTEVTLGKVAAELGRALGPERARRMLKRARFRHDAPTYEREYRRVFEAPIEFGCDRDVLEFPASLLGERFLTADPVLHGLLRRQAAGMLRSPERATLLERVRMALREELGRGTADQPSVARRVGVSTATLRRRLESEHGVRYTDVVDELRRERVVAQLLDPSVSIDEISYEAGFSQRSAFYRAFKRWYGCTPVQYRRAYGPSSSS